MHYSTNMIQNPGTSANQVVINRRVATHLISILPFALTLTPPSKASGILRYPITEGLNNTYYLVRAGETLAESNNRTLTNPVSKTSMNSALSPHGKDQINNETYRALKTLGACESGCWIWPSMHLAAYQSGELLCGRFGIGRNRLVPEFSKLDARGVGALEGGQLDVVAEELRAGDSGSPDWRPPKGDDGTPHESLEDILVRGRELLSLLETQYVGDNILLVSPDSYNFSVLQAAVLGVDLRAHERYALGPGEVRVLETSTVVERDDSPRQIPCPHPPQCK